MTRKSPQNGVFLHSLKLPAENGIGSFALLSAMQASNSYRGFESLMLRQRDV